MRGHSSIFKGGLNLGLGQVTSQVCSFVRSVIVARLISPENFGIAAVFVTTYVLLEMLSDLAADKLLIQAKDGDVPVFQKTAQLVQVGRCLTNAAILFLLGGPLSRLFGAPQAEWAFRCVGLIPLARAFMHLDMGRLQREMRFGPSVIVNASSNVLATLLALPLALWFRNYSAMLWILVLQAVSATVASHLVAERRYGWARHTEYAKRMFRFGWPLVINGLLMYGIFEGDRVIIGSAKRLFPMSTYTLADLGVYSVAFSVTMAPALFITNLVNSLFLPFLSRLQESLREFEWRYLRCVNAVVLLAAVVSISFIVGGGWVVTWVYGHKYSAAAGFIGWLGAMWGVRIIRSVPTLSAIARGDTKTSMVSNIVRSLALVGMALAAAMGSRLAWISICGFCGELLALGMLLWRLQRWHGIPAVLTFRPLAVTALGMAAGGLMSAAGIGSSGGAAAMLASLGLVLATLVAMLFVIPDLRLDLRALMITSISPLRAKVKVAAQVQQDV
jgi:O-antigen/teichoic acid export membrane protein